jgi:uncharacterized membrane protein YidH (DUF202 family)
MTTPRLDVPGPDGAPGDAPHEAPPPDGNRPRAGQPPAPAGAAMPAPPAAPEAPPGATSSRLARFGVALVVVGFAIFLVGLFPELVGLSLTPGIGLLQISIFLFGISVMTLGAYVYAYATRHRAMPRRLREDIGVRLILTGLVIAYTTGYADWLGIGSHFGADQPLLGPLQASGIALGLVVIVVGIVMYSRR